MFKRLLIFTIIFGQLLWSLPAAAQSVGLYVRNGTSSVTAPIANQTFVLDTSGVVPQLRAWNGATWIQITPSFNNYAGSGAPSVSNDNTQGYGVGSFWWDTIGLNEYVCTSAATGAATWNVITNRMGATDIALKFTTVDALTDFVVSGLLGTVPGSGFAMTTPGGTAYVSGTRIAPGSFNYTYSASSDTYDYLQSNGTVNHPAVANSAPAPTGQTGLLIQKVVTNGTQITTVTQMANTAPNLTIAVAANANQALNQTAANAIYSPIFNGAAAQFVATPVSSSGIAALRTIQTADLPIIPLSGGGWGTSVSPTINGIVYGASSSALGFTAAPSIAGTALGWNGTALTWLTVPGGATQLANMGYFGPKSGANALPTFRYLTQADYYGQAHVFNGRISAVTGVPVPATNQTNISTLYLTPSNGTICEVYNATNGWLPDLLTADVSVSLAGLIANTNVDLFAYDNSGALALEIDAWHNGQAATNNPAAGSSVVINMATTTAFAVGDAVCVKTGGSTEVAYVTAISAGVSITVDLLKLSYTTPTVYDLNNRVVAPLGTQDGVLVKASDHTRRFIATVHINSLGAQTDDNAAHRYIYNQYQQAPRSLFVQDGTANWAYSTATFRVANNDAGPDHAECVLGWTGQSIAAQYAVTTVNGTAGSSYCGIALDNRTTSAVSMGNSNNGNGMSLIAPDTFTPSSVGFHQIFGMEKGGAGTNTWYGTNAGGFNSWLSGQVMY